MKVYIAGSSTDIERAKKAADALEAHGLEVVSTWWVDVAEVGEGNPEDRETRARCVAKDLAEIAQADVLWLLVPEYVFSHGAFFELGAAHATGKLLVSSGATTRSIFTIVTREWPTDDDALAYLVGFSASTAEVSA